MRRLSSIHDVETADRVVITGEVDELREKRAEYWGAGAFSKILNLIECLVKILAPEFS